jgi:hypothetical protein
MSRHTLVRTEERLVIVGWDAPMGTFFAQEYDTTIPEDSDEDDLLWWVGDGMREIQAVEALAEQLATRGHALTEEAGKTLAAESNTPWTPGPLQRALGFTGKEEADGV